MRDKRIDEIVQNFGISAEAAGFSVDDTGNVNMQVLSEQVKKHYASKASDDVKQKIEAEKERTAQIEKLETTLKELTGKNDAQSIQRSISIKNKIAELKAA